MTSRRSARAACIAVATSLLGIFAAPQVASAAPVVIKVTDSGGTNVPRAFVAVLSSDGDAVDSTITDTDGNATVENSGGASLLVTAPGFQPKTVSTTTAQTVTLTASTKTKLSFSNAFGGQIRRLAADKESGVFYATSDAQPTVWRTTDYAGSWSPVPTSAETDTGAAPSSATEVFTSGVKGEVAVNTGQSIYYSRNYGNTWSQLSLAGVNGTNQKFFWAHAGTSSYLFVRTDSGLWAAIMPQADSDPAPTLASATGLGSIGASSKIAFAPAASGNSIFMAVSDNASGAVSVATLTSGATTVAGITASDSDSTGLSLTLTSSTSDFLMLSTLGSNIPKAVVAYDIESSAGNIKAASWTDGTNWTTTSAMIGATDANSNTLNTGITIGNQCGENGTSPVGSIAPAAPAGAVTGFTFAGSIRSCFFLVNNTGSSVNLGTSGQSVANNRVAVLPMSGANNNTGFEWDSGVDFTSNMVAISGDGQFGIRKSANIADGTKYRPNFGGAGGTSGTAYINSQADAGTATTSGGVAVNGLVAPNITDTVYSPNSTDGSYIVTSMTETGGSRTLLSTDGGKTYSTIGAGGSRSVDWWNGASGLQHIVGAFSNNASEWLHVKSFNTTSGGGTLQMGDELAATSAVRDAKSGGSPFVFPGTLSATVTQAKFANAEAGQQLLTKAIKGVPGYNKMLVAVNRCSDNIGPTGCSTSGGTVGMVTFTVDGTSGAQAVTETRYFGADVAAAGVTTSDATSNFGVSKNSTYSGGINALAVCPTGSVSRVADTAFVAVNGLGIYKITGLSGSTQAHSGPIVSGTFNDLKVDCDTGLMIAAGTDGAYFSLNGTTFTKINTSAAPAGGGGGGPSNAPSAVAVQADATSGEVVIGVASGNGDIKAVETNLTALGTSGAAMTATGAGPATPSTPVTPAADAINEVNSSSTGRNTGAVKDLEVPKSSTDKVTAAGVRAASVRAMATSLSLAAGTGGGAFTARVNSGGSSTSSGGTSTPIAAPTATTVTPVVVKTPSVKRGKTLTVVSALTTAGTTVVKGSKTSVVVATASKKICSATSTTIKGLKAGTCSLTVTVTPAKVTKTTNTTVTKGKTLTIASIASTNKLPSTSGATVAVKVSAGSKRVCTVSANKTVRAISNGKCTLTISVTGKKFTKKLLVKVS
jgi:hypothetical protein